jgi:hypothetical protein
MPGINRTGMTKELKRQFRILNMQGNRKREKATQRMEYHRQFRAQRGHRGYPKGPYLTKEQLGFLG